MFIRMNSSNESSSKETDEEEIEQEEKTMTRKEKKKENRSFTVSRKPEKFDVSQKDKMISHRRKSHKHNSTKTQHKRDTKSFYKFEGIFKRWLERNIERFNHKPIAQVAGEYTFEGIIENIKFGITDYEVYLSYEYEGGICSDKNETFFDVSFFAYIGDEKYHPQKGFYDGDRVDGVYTYFPTREALYINEVFAYAIEYCNEKFVPENCLYLYDSCGTTSAIITADKEADEKKEGYITGLHQTEYHKLFLEHKVYKTIKYDLFEISQEPLIRYTRRSKS